VLSGVAPCSFMPPAYVSDLAWLLGAWRRIKIERRKAFLPPAHQLSGLTATPVALKIAGYGSERSSDYWKLGGGVPL
jgi:hypothetical protein